MIIVAMGANLPHPLHGPPRATLTAALAALETDGIEVARRSRWYESPAFPPSDQPPYVNAVIVIATGLGPVELLARLHAVEAGFGRVRGARNEARMLDLDLLDYAGMVRNGPEPPVLPHPRLAGRAFVLLPLAEVAPEWRHPASGETVSALIAALPDRRSALPLDGAGGAADRP